MKGKYPVDYFRNPNMDKEKSIYEIWDDIDAYSGEFFEDEKSLHKKIDLMIPLPPLKRDGKFIKGILLTQSADYLIKLFPDIKKLFHVGAYSMWSSYPWADNADVYFCCYENKERENYYKSKYQNKKDIIFLPLQDADLTNEYLMAPAYDIEKKADLICVSTPYDVKNIPILAKAIKAYEAKYGKSLKMIWCMGLRDVYADENGRWNFSKLSKKSQEIINETIHILDNNPDKYLIIYSIVPHADLNIQYTSAKCTVLASLIEGKNRALNESMACNTPIVAFRQHNQWARGEHPIFFENSGELAEEFTPEAFADAIHKILSNPENYEPRKNYLKYNGRKNFINTCIDRIPYYRENLPEYQQGRFLDNIWVDLATYELYQVGYHDFLYGKAQHLSWVQGIERIRHLVKYYYYMFDIKES